LRHPTAENGSKEATVAVPDKFITYSDVVRRGALQVMSEAALRRISNDADRMTIGEMLRLPLNPRLLTCAVMHEDIVPGGVMRGIAAAIAADVIKRSKARGTYIDFRTRKAVDVARAFAGDQCSLGELRVACTKAEDARDAVMELGDQQVNQIAAIAISVCDPDSRSAILRTMADALDLFHEAEDEQRYIALISKMLQEVA
jgi:hypothetical protein